MLTAEEPVSYLTLLRNGNFLRFFLAQFVSSLGDWIGVIAIAVFARNLGGDTAVGAVMTARVLPGFIVGPLAGVIADRWDRKRTMVVADICRAAVIFSLPFVPNLLYLLLASVVLESLTLVWGPAKDASLPNFVPAEQLTHANSLSLISIYGPWPLSSIVYAFIATFGTFLATHVPALEGLNDNEEALALWLDSLTFAFSALMISTLTIASSRRRVARMDMGAIKKDLVEGLQFVIHDRQVRPWMLGIALTFTAAGAVFSLGLGFVEDILGGGPRAFAFVIGFFATGMIIGLLSVGFLAKRMQKDVLFSGSILLLGAGLIGLAGMSSLNAAIPMASALGFFGGAAYSTGYSLMQEKTQDEIRGRTFSAAYTLIRIGTLVGLGLFPFLAGAIGDHTLALPNDELELPDTRITFWIAGLVAIGGGILSMRAINVRTHPVAAVEPGRGYFVAFEGGEGAGKSTQMAAFVKWLDARGENVVITREPGGSSIGARIRELLLDPEAGEMSERTEALLYAADRAQHVKEIIKPALDAGKVVVSDRFVDSSLAYQGLARGLGLEEIYRISEWATEGLMPDLVIFLDVDPETGLGRVGSGRDRIENEADDFHQKVLDAYRELAEKYSDRFVVVDASMSPSEVHQSVVSNFIDRTRDLDIDVPPPDPAPSAGPVPR